MDVQPGETLQTAVVTSSRRGAAALGFTLIELCAAMSIFGILSVIAIAPMHRWMAGTRQGSTTSAVEALLRETQQRAVTEGRSLCVAFDLTAQTYSVLRGACGTAGQVKIDGPMRPDPGVRLASAAFAAPGGGTTAGVTFYARGTATPGQAVISRTGSTRVDTLVVEGLTGRVDHG
jgi:prepilin-type N-terminal cleavage/methylation domain-containing protein